MSFKVFYARGWMAGVFLSFSSLLYLPAPAQTIIYHDDFSGPVGMIDGRLPVLTNPTGQKWSADPKGKLATDSTLGSSKAVIAGGFESAYLPIKFDGHSIYTLSASILTTGGGGGAVTFGFVCGDSKLSYAMGASPKAWVMTQQEPKITQAIWHAVSGQGSAALLETVGAHTYSITLDSATGALSISSNGVLIIPADSAIAPADIPLITGVGFGAHSGAGYIENFTLIQEPKSASPAPKPPLKFTLAPGSY